MVQGVTINGKFRVFPTLPIASESKENLAQLKLAILNRAIINVFQTIESGVGKGKFYAK